MGSTLRVRKKRSPQGTGYLTPEFVLGGDRASTQRQEGLGKLRLRVKSGQKIATLEHASQGLVTPILRVQREIIPSGWKKESEKKCEGEDCPGASLYPRGLVISEGEC